VTERNLPLLTGKQIREIFRISVPTLARWIKKGCPFVQGATKKLYNLHAVRAWYEGEK
jgi:phage terminase Nu1 subunit (DNA packaging protein)